MWFRKRRKREVESVCVAEIECVLLCLERGEEVFGNVVDGRFVEVKCEEDCGESDK